MSKFTVRTNGGIVSCKPWMDSEGNPVEVVNCFFGDPITRLQEENAKLKEFLYDLANMIRSGDEDYACREITQWHREQCDD
jgi:hypothetical protein